MNPSDFKGLSDLEKVELLYTDGAYIGKLKFPGFYMLLFQLYGFYVEIHYVQYRETIEKFETFTDMKQLEQYFDHKDFEIST